MTQPQAPLDHLWHARFAGLSSVGEVFSQLELPSDHLLHLRRIFETSAYKKNLDLSAQHQNADSFLETKRELLELQKDIHNQERNQTVTTAYDIAISEAVVNTDLVLASIAGDMAKFAHYNQCAYGDPDPTVFAAACAWIRQQARSTAERSEFARDILDLIPDKDGDPNLLFPTDELFKTVKELHFAPGGYIENLFGTTPIPAIVTEVIGDTLCRRAIERLGSNFTIQDSPSGLWAVLSSRHAVIRPPKYSLTRKEFMALVVHEIGSHLAEYVNGSEQSLQLLGTGLDHYEAGNEGRACLREQIMYESPAEYSTLPSFQYDVALHIAVSLGVGCEDHPYTFSEIYNVIYRLYRFWNFLRDPQADDSKAHDNAWYIAVRVCKGTDGNGGVYRKDIVYLEGNIRCWRVAKDHPERIMQGDLGKFDIANPTHIKLLKTVKII